MTAAVFIHGFFLMVFLRDFKFSSTRNDGVNFRIFFFFEMIFSVPDDDFLDTLW